MSNEQLAAMAAEREAIKAKAAGIDARLKAARASVESLRREWDELARRHDAIGREAMCIIARGLVGQQVTACDGCQDVAGEMIETWRNLCVIRAADGEEQVWSLDDVQPIPPDSFSVWLPAATDTSEYAPPNDNIPF